MATVKELVSKWDASGRPRSTEGVAQVLRDSGLDEQQIKQVFDAQGIHYNIPTEIPDEIDDAQPEQALEPDMEIPVGFTLKTKTGAEIVWKGAQWTNKGKIVPKKYKEQLNKQAQKVLRQQMAQKQKDEEDAQRAKDAEYEFEDEPAPQQTQVDDKVKNMGKLQGLAQQIQGSKHKARIMQLLQSNDPLAQKAIAILLKGNVDEVLASLKAKK